MAPDFDCSWPVDAMHHDVEWMHWEMNSTIDKLLSIWAHQYHMIFQILEGVNGYSENAKMIHRRHQCISQLSQYFQVTRSQIIPDSIRSSEVEDGTRPWLPVLILSIMMLNEFNNRTTRVDIEDSNRALFWRRCYSSCTSSVMTSSTFAMYAIAPITEVNLRVRRCYSLDESAGYLIDSLFRSQLEQGWAGSHETFSAKTYRSWSCRSMCVKTRQTSSFHSA